MDLIERVKAECDRNLRCKTCKLVKSNGRCSLPDTPSDWDIKAIRKALGETNDKEEIVVPKKIATGYATKANPDLNARMINEIIDCLEQIKERLK